MDTEPVWVKWSSNGTPTVEWWLWGAVLLYTSRLGADTSGFDTVNGTDVWRKEMLRSVGSVLVDGISESNVGLLRLTGSDGAPRTFIAPAADANGPMPEGFVQELAALGAWLTAVDSDLRVAGDEANGTVVLDWER